MYSLCFVLETKPPVSGRLPRDTLRVPAEVAVESSRRRRYRRHQTPTAKLAAQMAVLTSQLRTRTVTVAGAVPPGSNKTREAAVQCDLLEGPPIRIAFGAASTVRPGRPTACGLAVNDLRRRLFGPSAWVEPTTRNELSGSTERPGPNGTETACRGAAETEEGRTLLDSDDSDDEACVEIDAGDTSDVPILLSDVE